MENLEQKVTIHDDYITLGQLLKEVGLISTGGQAKWFLQDTLVVVNEENENRRGKKLYAGDVIVIDDFGSILIEKES
ncbi:S4 domain-containing protein YaaA [Evansella cellulosilytica]|uniref:S4 domain protein YaaA n=1 Tax=Evansella cellulosilytica (strain ATCC 21833 / DSM 2522 / FERM P-1141 / JCM 9156 / N-4) TaxID=649639 RepID=E6TRK1_EVAC2|nr:S4 domain-containing protein YaaA [Evansella cellulosilytica]ADU28295.1 S4 domain protein YaaA [Evansella cellulosilytica DSM 2522]